MSDCPQINTNSRRFVSGMSECLCDLSRVSAIMAAYSGREISSRNRKRVLVRPVFCLIYPRRFGKKRLETSLTRGAGRHQSIPVRSKYFKKNEKKACQASKTPVILTAKPNQTNGETNDQIRTEHVRILPLGSRSRRRTSFPHGRQRLRARRSDNRASHRDWFLHPDRRDRIGPAGYSLYG